MNADSLATWFMSAAAEFATHHPALLDLRLDDQEHTAAAVSRLAVPVPGCRSLALGTVPYVDCASPKYVSRHFADGVDTAALVVAPCLVLNRKDRVQDGWVRATLGHHLALPWQAPRNATALLQALTEADCSAAGRALIPAATADS